MGIFAYDATPRNDRCGLESAIVKWILFSPRTKLTSLCVLDDDRSML